MSWSISVSGCHLKSKRNVYIIGLSRFGRQTVCFRDVIFSSFSLIWLDLTREREREREREKDHFIFDLFNRFLYQMMRMMMNVINMFVVVRRCCCEWSRAPKKRRENKNVSYAPKRSFI